MLNSDERQHIASVDVAVICLATHPQKSTLRERQGSVFPQHVHPSEVLLCLLHGQDGVGVDLFIMTGCRDIA